MANNENQQDINNTPVNDASSVTDMSIDDFLRSAGVSEKYKIIANTLYGIKHTKSSLVPQKEVLYKGYTFFTRPQLNLRSSNLRNVRTMYNLLEVKPKGLGLATYVRCTLDPRLSRQLYINGKIDNFYKKEIVRSALVDEYSPFINILTNLIKNLSGWPDEVLPIYTSKEGMMKDQIIMADGAFEIYNSFDLTATFTNIDGNPLTLLFQTWYRYQSYVFRGLMEPYIDMILENEIDYNTRIWRIVTKANKEDVSYIGATGACIVRNNDMGKVFDFNSEVPYIDQTSETSISFSCVGAMYNDDILIKEFNETFVPFNPYYKAYLNGVKAAMVEIPKDLASVLNYRGYPYIDPKKYKLKWLIPVNSPSYKYLKELQNKKDSELEKALSSLDNYQIINKGV